MSARPVPAAAAPAPTSAGSTAAVDPPADLLTMLAKTSREHDWKPINLMYWNDKDIKLGRRVARGKTIFLFKDEDEFTSNILKTMATSSKRFYIFVTHNTVYVTPSTIERKDVAAGFPEDDDDDDE